jgi:DNA uptake protein ComE-like DNA-binding protein
MNNKGYKNMKIRLFAKKKSSLIDINLATQEELIKIYGIEKYSTYLKIKESLGGFVSMEQMNDVWGLSPEVKRILIHISKCTLYLLYIKLT